MGAAVIDFQYYRFPIPQIRDLYLRSEWQRTMRRRVFVHIETLATGSSAAVKKIAIIRSSAGKAYRYRITGFGLL